MSLKRVVIIGVAIALVFSILIVVLYELSDKIEIGKKEEEPDPKTVADQQLEEIEGSENFEKVALVGKEYLFEDDIKRYLSSRGRTSEFADEKAREEALEYLMDESVTLQQGEKNGWISLDTKFFNNPKKDSSARRQALFDVELNFSAFNTEGNKVVEGITLFFVNTIPGELVEEKGRDYVKDLVYGKIQTEYNDVKNGDKTIKEAADVLISDSDMPKIDPNYKSGIYVKPLATSPNAQEGDRFYGWEEVIVLSKGEMTEILLFEEGGMDGFYTFYKVVDEVKSEYSSQEDWVKEIKDNYIIEKYI